MEQDPKRRADVDAIGWTQDDFTHDLGHGELPEQRVAGHHEAVEGAAGELSKEERARLTILADGGRPLRVEFLGEEPAAAIDRVEHTTVDAT